MSTRDFTQACENKDDIWEATTLSLMMLTLCHKVASFQHCTAWVTRVNSYHWANTSSVSTNLYYLFYKNTFFFPFLQFSTQPNKRKKYYLFFYYFFTIKGLWPIIQTYHSFSLCYIKKLPFFHWVKSNQTFKYCFWHLIIIQVETGMICQRSKFTTLNPSSW
jgi:hypothetical protein